MDKAKLQARMVRVFCLVLSTMISWRAIQLCLARQDLLDLEILLFWQRPTCMKFGRMPLIAVYFDPIQKQEE